MATKFDKLAELGYDVNVAIDNDTSPLVYFVSGPGVQTYITEDDDETAQSLIDSHDERVKREDEGYVPQAPDQAELEEEESAVAHETSEDPSSKD